MTYNWQAILGGLLGGVLAALVATYATTQMLPVTGGWYAVPDLVWAGVVTAVGGVLGVGAGWFVNGRRARGLGGVAALTSLIGALGGTLMWARASQEDYEVLAFLTGVVLMVGGLLVLLALACGMTASLLRLQSVNDETSRRIAEHDRL